jgi:hypothetical protein
MDWLLVGLAGLLLVLGIVLLKRRRKRRHTDEIPLIVDLARLSASPSAPDAPLWHPAAPLPAAQEPSAPRVAPAPVAPPATAVAPAPFAPPPRLETPAPLELAPAFRAHGVQVAAPAERTLPMGIEVAANGASVPAAKPISEPFRPESTVQLLPGRLEVLEGKGLGQEIRLFRLSSLEDPEITFGRSEGPEYRHVQLKLPTVSRMHARVRFQERRWRISNLSEVNPVVVNDQEMAHGEEVALQDGDQIRIGEAVFRFHYPQR